MFSLRDHRGFNQGFKPTRALYIRMEKRSERLLREMTPIIPLHILEIGCGTGELADSLMRKTNAVVYGMDRCPEFIQTAQTRYPSERLVFQQGDFITVDFEKQRFDYIVGNGILHHLSNHLDESLYKMVNLLNEQGKIIFFEPNLLNPYCLLIFKIPLLRKLARLDPDEMAFTRRSIRNTLTMKRFHAVKVEYRDFLLPITPRPLIRPLLFIGRIMEQIPIVQMLAQSLFISAQINEPTMEHAED
jgi:2-polyprenyl-3-methyl-5-hydroxy-6-metoxy-1,4-benzoquinol methylase